MRPHIQIRESTTSLACLLVFALIALVRNLASAPDPGLSAAWLHRQFPDSYLIPSATPVSGAFAALAALIFPGWFPLALGILNLVFALAVLGLVHACLRRLPMHHAETAALAGTLLLSVSPGFGWAATRPHSTMTGLLLLVLSCWLILRGREDAQTGPLLHAAFLAGLAAVEYPFAAIAAPFLILWMIGLTWRKPALPGILVLSFCGAVAGALLLFRAWAPDESLLLFRTWRSETAASLTPPGWMAVTALSLGLAWFGLHPVIRRRKRIRRRTRIIQAALVPVMLALFVIDPFAPEALNPTGAPMILPWVVLAAAFAGQVSFWLHASGGRRAAIRIITASVILLAGVGAILRHPGLSVRPAANLMPVWEAAFDGLGDEPWLVSDGASDAPIAIAARMRRKQPVFLHPGAELHKRYRLELAARLNDPRERVLAGIGIGPLVAERLKTQDKPVAALGLYPPLVVAGFQPLPDRIRYLPHPPAEPVDARAALARNLSFWRELDPVLAALERRRNALGRTATELRAYMSRLANDLGVALEQHGQTEDATACYIEALTLNPGNLSAALNLTPVGDPAQLPSRMARELEALCGPGWQVRLAMTSGLIAGPDTRRAIDTLCQWRAPADTAAVALAPIVALRLSGQTNEAWTALQAYTRDHPDDETGWILLAALAAERASIETLEAARARMRDLGKSWPPVLMLLGEQALADRRYDDAHALLREAHAGWPMHVRILETLVQLELHRQDEDALDRHLRTLLSIDPWNPWGNFALGLGLVKAGDPGEAERALRIAANRASLPEAHNNLAWILLGQGRLNEALYYARQAIAGEPYGAAQWDTLAEILTQTGDQNAARIARETARRLTQPEP